MDGWEVLVFLFDVEARLVGLGLWLMFYHTSVGMMSPSLRFWVHGLGTVPKNYIGLCSERSLGSMKIQGAPFLTNMRTILRNSRVTLETTKMMPKPGACQRKAMT